MQMMPAPGQGALAVECRLPTTDLGSELLDAGSTPRCPALRRHAPSRSAVTAERGRCCAAVGAGCAASSGRWHIVERGVGRRSSAPARSAGDQPTVSVMRRRPASAEAAEPASLGRHSAAELLDSRRRLTPGHDHRRHQAAPAPQSCRESEPDNQRPRPDRRSSRSSAAGPGDPGLLTVCATDAASRPPTWSSTDPPSESLLGPRAPCPVAEVTGRRRRRRGRRRR